MNQNWWILLIVLVIIIVLLVLWWQSRQNRAHGGGGNGQQLSGDQHKQLVNMSRSLDKLSYIQREYLIAILSKQGGFCTGQVADRLANASSDMGNIFASFTNSETGTKLTELLTNKGKLLENIIVLLKNKQPYNKELEAVSAINAQQAELLASTIPGIDKAKLQGHLDSLFAKTIDEAKAIMSNQCMNSLTIFETDIMDANMALVNDLMGPLAAHLRKQ